MRGGLLGSPVVFGGDVVSLLSVKFGEVDIGEEGVAEELAPKMGAELVSGDGMRLGVSESEFVDFVLVSFTCLLRLK